jgi:hypothetical protein
MSARTFIWHCSRRYRSRRTSRSETALGKYTDSLQNGPAAKATGQDRSSYSRDYVSDTQRFDLLLTDGRAKSAADLPITEAAKLRNDGVKQDLLSLRAQQIALSDEVEGLKRERSAIMEQVVSSLTFPSPQGETTDFARRPRNTRLTP